MVDELTLQYHRQTINDPSDIEPRGFNRWMPYDFDPSVPIKLTCLRRVRNGDTICSILLCVDMRNLPNNPMTSKSKLVRSITGNSIICWTEIQLNLGLISNQHLSINDYKTYNPNEIDQYQNVGNPSGITKCISGPILIINLCHDFTATALFIIGDYRW